MVGYDNAYSALAKATHCKAFPDLYSARARRLIGQLCREFLDSAHMIPTELVYSRPHQKALLDKGMFLRNAIQQVATAQVSEGFQRRYACSLPSRGSSVSFPG